MNAIKSPKSDNTKEWFEELNFEGYEDIPERTREALQRYVTQRCGVGHFLTAVLCNDLQGAFAHADTENLVALPNLVKFVYSRIPAICWGDAEKVSSWFLNGADK